MSGDIELNPGPTGSSSSSTDPHKCGAKDQSTQVTACHLFRECSSCKVRIHVRQKVCKSCGSALKRHVWW